MKSLVFILFFGYLFSACTDEVGNKVIGGELTVHFSDKEDLSMAENLAVYWKENGFITGKKQDVLFLRKDKVFVLKLIANDPGKVAEMEFYERKKLLELQHDLEESVFDRAVEIEIANKKFETIYTLN